MLVKTEQSPVITQALKLLLRKESSFYFFDNQDNS